MGARRRNRRSEIDVVRGWAAAQARVRSKSIAKAVFRAKIGRKRRLEADSWPPKGSGVPEMAKMAVIPSRSRDLGRSGGVGRCEDRDVSTALDMTGLDADRTLAGSGQTKSNPCPSVFIRGRILGSGFGVLAGVASPAGSGGENSPPPAQGRPTTDPEAKNRLKRARNGPKRHFEAFWGLRRACKPDFRPQMDGNSRKWGSGREFQQENRKFA